jgi:drug/metabolite transporter (DMT)-like permease
VNAVELRGLFFALMSGLCGALFAQAYKLRTQLGYRPRPLILTFAVWYCVLSAVLASVLGAWRYSPPLLALGVTFGLLFLTAIYLYMRVSERARLNISWTIVQISVVLPFGLSIVFFGERPNLLSWAGIGSIGAAIFIFALAKWREGGRAEAGGSKTLLMLAASSILTGLNMFIPKVLNHVYPGGTIFSMLPYTGAAMLAFAFVLARIPAARVRVETEGRSAGGAVLLLFAAYMVVASSTAMVFVYYSLKSLAGAIVYPVRNVACVLIVTLLAAVLFRERISKLELLGMGLSIGGIALISAAL